jgi:hypothetical protein
MARSGAHRGMIARKDPALRVCGRCNATPATARFLPTSARRCIRCQAIEKAERAKRKMLRQPPQARRRRSRIDKCSPHLAWIRSLRCLTGRRTCGTFTHAHHVRQCTGAGTAMKPDDRWAVPLCPSHHSEGHTGGWATFEAKYSVNLRAAAEGLAAASPYLPHPERIADASPIDAQAAASQHDDIERRGDAPGAGVAPAVPVGDAGNGAPALIPF